MNYHFSGMEKKTLSHHSQKQSHTFLNKSKCCSIEKKRRRIYFPFLNLAPRMIKY